MFTLLTPSLVQGDTELKELREAQQQRKLEMEREQRRKGGGSPTFESDEEGLDAVYKGEKQLGKGGKKYVGKRAGSSGA